MSAMPLARNGNFLGLLIANTVLGSAMPILIVLGGLAGLALAPSTALATLPASVQMLAGLLAAAPFSMFMGRFGRRSGFMLGVGFATIGAVLGICALFWNSFLLLCIAHLALGAALSCYQFFRFAAAEVVDADWQPVAISLMLTSGLVAAFVGPQVFIMAKDLLSPVPLAGAYAAIAAMSLIGLVPLIWVSIPAATPPAVQAKRRGLAALSVLRHGPVRMAVILGAVSQGIMVFLMVPTPVAMIGYDFSEATAGDVIRWHVVAMFAPSFFTGFLIKRFGTMPVAITGILLLILAAVAAAAGLTSLHFYGALILLGIGWNFSFIGATTLLAASVAAEEKPLVQGVNDTLIALFSTLCAFAAGAIVAGFGWTVLALCALAVLALVLGAVVTQKHQGV